MTTVHHSNACCSALQILHSEKEEDIATRSSIYFMITPEGSLRSQEVCIYVIVSLSLSDFWVCDIFTGST